MQVSQHGNYNDDFQLTNGEGQPQRSHYCVPRIRCWDEAFLWQPVKPIDPL